MAVLISAQNQEFGAALKQSQAQLSAFEKGVNTANNTLKSFGIGFGLYQVTAAVGDAINVIADFEQQMATTKAITGATQKEFDALTRSALELGSSTQFSAKQVGELQTEFGRLGFSTAEILNATKATISLATATGEDLAKSADVAGSTLRAFGLSTENTQKVVDIMAAGFNRSALSLENFSEAIKFVAPVARAAGVSLEETTALLGILADNGIRGSIAGTSLRKIITDLANSGKPLNERLADLAKTGLTFTGAFDEVGRTAQSSLLVLTENKEKIDAFAKSLGNVSGEAEKTANIVGDTLRGDLKRLGGAWDGLVISFSNGTGAIRQTVQLLTGLVNVIKTLSENTDISKFASNVATAFLPNPKDLENLKKFRDAAIQSGNKEAADAATKSIIDITNAYHLLGKQAKKTGEDVAGVDDKDKDKKKEQLSLIQQLEAELSIYEERKKASFSTAEITALNDKIKGVRDQIELLNQTSLSPGANTPAAPVTPGSKTGTDFLQETGAFTSVTDGISTIDVEAPKAVEAINAITDAWIASGEASKADAEAKAIAFADQQAKQEQLQQIYQRGADIIINSTAQVISGQKTALQAIKQITGQLISLFLQQALAGTIAGAAKTTAPPPVIVALAAAGVAAVSALFTSAVGGASGASAAGAMSSSPALRAENFSSGSKSDTNVIVTGRIEASGRKLQVILDNQENKSGRTG
jgi:hypothetical protein